MPKTPIWIPAIILLIASGCIGSVTEDESYDREDRAAIYYDKFYTDYVLCKSRGGVISIERRQPVPLQCMSQMCPPEPGDIYRCKIR